MRSKLLAGADLFIALIDEDDVFHVSGIQGLRDSGIKGFRAIEPPATRGDTRRASSAAL
jgi:hypothetical protein